MDRQHIPSESLKLNSSLSPVPSTLDPYTATYLQSNVFPRISSVRRRPCSWSVRCHLNDNSLCLLTTSSRGSLKPQYLHTIYRPSLPQRYEASLQDIERYSGIPAEFKIWTSWWSPGVKEKRSNSLGCWLYTDGRCPREEKQVTNGYLISGRAFGSLQSNHKQHYVLLSPLKLMG